MSETEKSLIRSYVSDPGDAARKPGASNAASQLPVAVACDFAGAKLHRLTYGIHHDGGLLGKLSVLRAGDSFSGDEAEAI